MLLTLLAAGALAQAAPAIDPAIKTRIDAILAATPLVDGHNDLPFAVRLGAESSVKGLQSGTAPRLMTDMDRLRAGGVGGQLWSVYIPATVTGDEAIRYTLEQLDVADRLIAQYPETLAWARTADEIEAIHRSGRIASLAGIEGGHQIGGNLAALRQFKRLGAIYMTLTHSKTTGWADSATDAPKHGGLSAFGKRVVGEMNRIGMLVDLSHVSEEAMHDALDATKAPVIFSHSSARAIGQHPRNVPDSVLQRLPDNGGVVMVTFVPPFLENDVWAWSAARDAEGARLDALFTGNPEGRTGAMAEWDKANPRPATDVTNVADHVDHIVSVAGVDHVGIGGDLDGIPFAPDGLGSADGYPLLFAELIRRGWSDENLAKLAGGNFLRALRGAEATAAAMRDMEPALDKPEMAD